ncbi:MAG: cation:proton antiporter [Puniceicoccaceae bacterium]
MAVFGQLIMEQMANPILAASAHGTDGWIDDFGIVLAAAGLAVAIFYRLRLPVIFGYILTGVLIGPSLFSSPLIEDADAIQQISELGVIFLLFFIGMEFDLKRLQRVIGPAFMSLLLQTLFMLYLAQILALFLDWNPTSTLFFGSLLAISSSMVTVRVLRERNLLKEAGSQFTIGILILEDVLAVILLVILTGVGVTQSFDWDAAWLVTFLMGIFVVMVFVIGRAIVPRVLLAVSGEEKSAEVITLVSVGLVMGVSMLALRLDFSPALGAFVAGTLLSQTQIAQTVEHMNRSLHDVFSAVFFVSIGMMLDPALLVANIGAILIISLLVIILKILACWGGLSLAGQPGKTAFMAAVPKAQIGEFSFIIAGLGTSLGVMDKQLSGIAFGVALMTILLTPFVTRVAEPSYNIILRAVPRGLVVTFETYQKFIEGLLLGLGRNMVLKLIQRPILQIVIYFFIINGIFIAASFATGWYSRLSEGWPMEWAWMLGYWLMVGIIVSPFLIAVLRNLNATAYILSDALFSGLASSPTYKHRLRQMLSAVILGAFLFLVGTTFMLVAAPYLPNTAIAGLAFLIVAAVVIALRSRFILVNSQMELLFMESFIAEVTSKEEERRESILQMIKNQTPWPVEIVDLTLPVHAAWSGKRIRELNLRARYGINVLALGRGYSVVYDPAPDAPVFSGDRLVLTGSKQSIDKVRAGMQAQVKPDQRPVPTPDQFRLDRAYVNPHSELDGQTLAGGRIRQRFGVTVIGIQRGDERILNPGHDFLINAGDVLLIAGLPGKIEAFTSACGEKPLPVSE